MAQAPVTPNYSPFYDPATQLDLLRQQRNMALSSALLQQTLTPQEPNMMAGRYVVAQSPIGNIARLGAALLANRNINSGLEKQLGAQQAQFESMGQGVDAATQGQYVTGNRTQDILMMRDNPEEYQKRLAERNAYTNEYKDALQAANGDQQLAKQFMLQGKMKANSMEMGDGQYYVDPITKRVIAGMPKAPIEGAQPVFRNGQFVGWDTNAPAQAAANKTGMVGSVEHAQQIASTMVDVTKPDGSVVKMTMADAMKQAGIADPMSALMGSLGQQQPNMPPQQMQPGSDPAMPGLVNVPQQPMPQAGDMRSWQVPPSVQAARDNNRGVLLQNELAGQQQLMQDAIKRGDRQAFDRAQSNMGAIQKELRNMGAAPSAQPVAAPAGVVTTPPAAAVAKNKAATKNIQDINDLYQGPNGVINSMTRNQNALQSLTNAYQLVAKGTNVGPGNTLADTLSKYGNEIGLGPAPSTENRQAFNKYISDVLAQFGGSTDAERANLAHTLPGVDFTNRDAALKVLPTIMGRVKAQIDQGRAAQQWAQQGKDLTEFHQRWQTAYNPEAYHFQQAPEAERVRMIQEMKRNGTLESFKKSIASMQALGASL